jgi:hypothetical protein
MEINKEKLIEICAQRDIRGASLYQTIENVRYFSSSLKKEEELSIGQIVDYLLSLSTKDLNEFYNDVLLRANIIRHKRQIESDKKYKDEKERKEKRGEEFKKILKVGDVIKVEGTRDGNGYREVLNTNDYQVSCRKLVKKLRTKSERMLGVPETYITFKRDNYITTHLFDKIQKIYFKDQYQIID